MKQYNITVNGTTYAVEVEEIGVSTAAPVTPTAASTPTPVAVPVAATPPSPMAAAEPTGGAQTIESPMPGTILDVRVSPGQTVAEGDVLIILEAMKMENEIMAPSAGTIASVPAAKGAAVNAGDVLVTLK